MDFEIQKTITMATNHDGSLCWHRQALCVISPWTWFLMWHCWSREFRKAPYPSLFCLPWNTKTRCWGGGWKWDRTVLGRGVLTVKAKPWGIWGVILTPDTQQWHFPANLPSYTPHKSMPGTTHVPTMSLSSPKLQSSLPAPSSLPDIQPATQSESTRGISQDTSPGSRKVLGRWHTSSAFQHTLCVNGKTSTQIFMEEEAKRMVFSPTRRVVITAGQRGHSPDGS